MSLLIDSDQVATSDLVQIDPELQDIADVENVVVSGIGSVISTAWDKSSDELLNAVQAFGGNVFGVWPQFDGGFGRARPRIQLQQIVTSDAYGARVSPLRRWMIYGALTEFYRAAIRRNAKDRYQTKLDVAIGEQKTAWRNLTGAGLPCIAFPLACPGATHDLLAGTWSAANLSVVTSGSSPASVDYDVVITWVDSTSYASPTNTQNGESGASAIATITVPAGQVLSVSIAGLNAPGVLTIQRGIANGAYYMRKASGWNVYVSAKGAGLFYLQNSTPIALSTTSYQLSAAPALSGYILQPGQVPDANVTLQRMLQRA